MSIEPGRHLGPYETLSLLGKGGMGEVYRARDSRLGREVAIKVLPDEVARDPERLARFQREARALAALNHPHVATLHGLEQHEGKDLLVMELVLGETLADRIARGPIPVDEAVPIFLQIAEGLEAAHEKGIIHRDLKPANVKLGADGASVKILDFGLAKAMAPEDSTAGALLADGAAAGALTHSPTLTLQATRRGEILGTAQYMSPEQSRGLPVDRRSDVWAFGACLYEALSGKPPFAGDDVSSILAAVIRDEPDLGALPAGTPLAVRAVIRRCLAKRAKDRLRDLGDIALELQEALAPSAEADALSHARAGTPRRSALAWALAGAGAGAVAVGVAMLAAGGWPSRATASASPVVRSIVSSVRGSPYTGVHDGVVVAVSRDGRAVAWLGQPGTPWSIYLRRVDELEARPLEGTEGASDPAFSPDGEWIAFVHERTLEKISTKSGGKVRLGEAPLQAAGLSWGDDGMLYVGSSSGLYRVSSAGGELELVVAPDASDGEMAVTFPEVLPGGRAALVTLARPPAPMGFSIAFVDLATHERRTLVARGSQPRFVSSGHLVFASGDGSLAAVVFDAKTLETHGDPISVARGVAQVTSTKATSFSASAGGSLAYLTAAGARQMSLVWVNRAGLKVTWNTLESANAYPRLSPDGQRLALARGSALDQDLWTLSLEDGAWARVTFEPGTEAYPTWSPSGKAIYHSKSSSTAEIGSLGETHIMMRAADGTGGYQALSEENDALPSSVSPDGRYLVYRRGVFADLDVQVLTLDTGEARALLTGPADEYNGEISPDGRWLAYQSNELSGRYEVYVRPFPAVETGKWQVSTGGGVEPLWSRDGKELFYREGDRMMAAPVETGAGFRNGTPIEVFRGRYKAAIGRNYDNAPDGSRFLMVEDTPEGGEPPRIVLVQNFGEELKRLLPVE